MLEIIKGNISEQAARRSRILVLLTAAAFIVFGVTRGEAGTVLTKAVNICLECIGIG